MLLLLLFALLGACCATPVTTICSEDEIVKPIREFNKLVDEMQSPLVSTEKILEQILTLVVDTEDYYDRVNETCGDEKIGGLNKLESFLMDIHVVRMLEMSFLALADDMDTIVERFENFGSKQIRHYIIAQFYTMSECYTLILRAIEFMKNDTNIINEMHEGLIYTLNDTNAHLAKDLVPLMSEFITQHNEGETLAYAKNNLKIFVERSIHNYSDALVLLNEVDSKLADQTVKDVIQNSFTNSIFSKVFRIVNNLPTVHLKAIALKSLNDKIVSMDLQSSLVSTKVYVLSKDMIREGNINDTEDIEILNNIVENATKFSKSLVYGHSCGSIRDEDKVHHDEYIVNIFIEHPNEIGSVLKAEEDGTLLRINFEGKNHADDMKYSLLLEADDYSDNINLPVISKKRYSIESLTSEKICELNPSPEYNICIPTLKFLYYTHEEADSVRNQSIEILQNFKSPCTTE